MSEKTFHEANCMCESCVDYEDLARQLEISLIRDMSVKPRKKMVKVYKK